MRRIAPWLLALAALGTLPAQTRRPRQKPAATPAATPAAAPAPPREEGAAYPIQSLKVDGTQNYTVQQVLAVAGLRIGQKAGKVEFEEARARLAATGVFDNLGYRYAPSKDGKGYDVTIEVAEMAQMYPLRFEDLPASDDELRAFLHEKDPLFGPKIPATKTELDRYAHWIGEFVAGKEFKDGVIGRVIADSPSNLVILFRPSTPRPAIAHVRFTNTGVLPEGMLRTAMYGVAIGVGYNERAYRVLLETTIRPLYEARGMIKVTFPKIEIAPAQDSDGVVVTTEVVQGPVYKLEHVRYTGVDATSEEFDKLANLKIGKPVDFDDVKGAVGRIAERLHRAGYLEVATKVLRDAHDSELTIDLTFQITPGPAFSMGQLAIVGLDLESEPVIRKMWALEPGKPYNSDYPDHFLTRIREGGVFDNLKTTRAETKVDSAARTVDVTLYFNK